MTNIYADPALRRNIYSDAPVRPTETQTEAPKLTRTKGELAKDLGMGVVQGASNLLGGTAELINTATGGLLDKGLGYAQGAVNKVVNGGEFKEGPGVTGAYGEFDRQTGLELSPLLRRKQQELADTKGFFASAKKVVTDPALAGQFVAEQVASLAVPALGARGTLVKATEAAAAKGLGVEAAKKAGRKALERQLIANEVIQEAGPAAMQTRQELAQLPQATWDANPDYQARVAAGEAPEAVKESMANVAALKAAGVGGAAGALGGKITAGLEGKIFTGALDHSPLLSRGGAKELLSTVGKEATEETVQEGGAQVGTNLGVQGVDATRSLMEGVPEAAGTGAALGGLIGGGLHVAGSATSPLLTRGPAPEPLALPAPDGTPSYGAETITVAPDGTASTMAQSVQAASEREAMGLTPDVNAARAAHPGAAPNVPFAGAAPGSLADSVNATAEAAAPASASVADDAAELEAFNESLQTGEPVAAVLQRNQAPAPGSLADAVSVVVPNADQKVAQGQPEEGESQALNPVAGTIKDQPAITTETPNGSEKAARLEQDAGVQSLAERGGPLPQSEQSSAPQLRGQGDNAAPAVGAELPGVPAGSGAANQPEPHAGTDGQREGLSAGERSLGDAKGAGQQPAQDAPADVPGANQVADSVGGATGAGAIDAAVPSQSGRNVGGASADNPASERTPSDGASPVAAAAMEAATSPENSLKPPSEAQKEAGNFTVGRMKVNGLDISIEHPAGVKRKAEHSQPLAQAYGYIRRTEGADGEKFDVFLGDRADDTSLPVFVVDQKKADGSFDESKGMLGFDTEAAARDAYLSNYPKGWEKTGLGGIRQMTQDEFKSWVKDAKATQKPAATEESSVVAARLARVIHKSQGVAYLREKLKITKAEAAALFDSIDRKGLKEGMRLGADVAAAVAPKAAQPEPSAATDSDELDSATEDRAPREYGPAIDDEIRPAGRKRDHGFKSASSVTAELAERDLNPDDYSIEKTEQGGYIGKKKATGKASPKASEQVSPPAAEAAQAPPRDTNSSKPTAGEKAAPVQPTNEAPLSDDAESVRAELSKGWERQFQGNTIFTADKVAAAKARMKAKLGQLNSGIDPEMFADGVMIAGGYIEVGVRKFGDYAKAMVEAMGDGIKPYLLSFYEGVRHFPGVDRDGMDTPDAAAREFDELLTPADTKTEAVGTAKPSGKKRVPNLSKRGALKLTDDWGTDAINGYGESPDRETGNTTKDAFLKEARDYLKAVSEVLEDQGYTVTLDLKGKPTKAVHVNESGTAGSGDVHLHMIAPSGTGIYATIGDSSLRGVVPMTTSGITLMYRTTDGSYGKSGANQWGRVDLAAAELAAELADHAERNPLSSDKRPAKATDQAHNAPKESRNDDPASPGIESTQALEGASSGDGGLVESGGAARGEGAERGADGAEGNPGAGPQQRVQGARGRGGRAAETDSAQAGSGRRTRVGTRGAGQEGSGLQEDDGGAGGRGRVESAPTDSPSAIPASNFEITDDVQLGQGGEAVKFRDNLAAIQVLKTLEREQRRATAAEQKALARYVGWGGLANAFADPDGNFKPDWAAKGAELAKLLTEDELKAARRSTRNAHYTSKAVVQGVWAGLQRIGYKGGMVLEPAMGTGNFIGLAPEALASSSRFVGVEYDSLTARIAGALYPRAGVLHSGFQKVPIADGAFDLVIGNPPFGQEKLKFQHKPELNGHSIHNQFFIAGLDALREGGIMSMVVSRYLMDAVGTDAREAMAARAELVGAIRLPDVAFKENARTDVVTDVLFFRKRSEASRAELEAAFTAMRSPATTQAAKNRRDEAESKIPAWVNTGKVADPAGGEAMTVSQYFIDNPAMVLGTMDMTGKMQMGASLRVHLPKGADFDALLQGAIDRLPRDAAEPLLDPVQAAADRFENMVGALRVAMEGREPGSVRFEADGRLVQVVERETPEGEYELTTREITAQSAWSNQLMQAADGRYFRMVEKLDAAGNKVKDGRSNVYERESFATDADIPASMRLGEAKFDRLKEMVRLRDLLSQQLTIEAEDRPTDELEANRTKLRDAYKAFIKKHDYISTPKNAAIIADMPDGALVEALELSYRPEITKAKAAKMGEKPRPASAKMAAILNTRVVVPYVPPTEAASPQDAFFISLSEFGKLDMDRVAELLGTDVDGAIEAVSKGEKPLAFFDPEEKTWQTANDYLSGNVRRKLNAAQEAGMQANVAALEAVQPEPWGAEQITVLMGGGWVPGEVYADFLQHLVGGKARVTFSRITNSFDVRNPTADRARDVEWGTDAFKATELVAAILNSRPIKVSYKTHDGKTVVDAEATALAQLKAKQIVNEFADWVFQDGDRRNLLVKVFNDKFNTRAARQHDGSHLKLPGKVPDSIIQMRRHQMNAIWRGITERFTLYDHAVGAGKTFTGIARALERRRMGLSRKPMIAVPNHMVGQFTADAYRLYPGAKVLAAGQKDFERSRRRKLFAKIATGDWDLVIVPHSSFGFIGISPEAEQRFLEHEIDLAIAAVAEAEEQAEEDGNTGFRKPFNVKEAERLLEKLTQRMEGLGKQTRDRLLSFEQLGVDDLTIDEAHEFKNLFYSSRLTGVRGMGDKTGSQKAYDLYNKVRVLRESKTGAVTFMTGTPISNSAVEMYTMMRYLAADDLADLGLEHFDAWRAQFVEAETKFEPTESGRLKEVNRLGRTWSNMRSLMELYYSFTDAVSNEDIKKWYAEDHDGKEFPLPKVKGGERQQIITKPTVAQSAMLEQVMSAFDALPSITNPIERNKARLRLMDKARKLSLDIRAVEPWNPSKEEGGKLEQVADQVKRIYDQWSAEKGTQLVFLDRSVPKGKDDQKVLKAWDKLEQARDNAARAEDEEAFRKAADAMEEFTHAGVAYDASSIEAMRAAQSGGWNAYQQIKDNLVALGIPEKEVRFVQEANNDAQKQAMFDAVNAGEVRVLIGSTPRMGAGTNVQQKLVGLHHVDVTWKPSDIEQREGRIIRQGNLIGFDADGNNIRPDFEVEILAYATERTVDAKMWDLNSTKLKTINGIRKYDGAFSMDFNDEDAVGMAEMAALASGDPKLLERVTLMAEIDRLELLERAYRRKQFGLKDSIDRAKRNIGNLPQRIARAEKLSASLDKERAAVVEREAKRSVVVEGVTYTDAGAAKKAAVDAMDAQKAENPKAPWSLSIGAHRVTTKEGLYDAIQEAMGDDSTFEVTIKGKPYITRTAAARELVDVVNGMTSDSETITVGSLLGLDLVLDRNDERAFVSALDPSDKHTIASAETAPLKAGGDGKFTAQALRGTLGALENRVDSAVRVGWMRRDLEEAGKMLPALEAQSGKPFEQADELRGKRERLEQLTRELASDGKPSATPDAGLRSNPDPAAKGGTGKRATDLRTAIASIIGTWGATAPRVVVVDTAQDLPAIVRTEAGWQDVEGWYDGKSSVYLVAGNLTSDERARRVLAHEAVGHYGIEAITGEREWAQITETVMRMMKSGAEPELFAELARRYKGAPESVFVREAVAVMAEKGMGRGILTRLAAAFVRFLRGLGFNIEFTAIELRAMIGKAARHLSGKSPTPGTDPGDGVPAFSRAAESQELELDTAFVAGLTAKERKSSAVTALAEGLWRTLRTESPFFRTWFGDSKVVDAKGQPMLAYHGTAAEFEAFDPKKLGASTNHMTASLGHFFAENKANAERYAKLASNDVPAEEQVYEVYLAIANPYRMTEAEFMGIDSTDAAAAMRKRLVKEGHDGIQLEGIGQWIAFKPEQIKRTSNRGTFDKADAGLLFSRPDPATVLDAMGPRALPDSVVAKLRSWWNGKPFSSTVENTRPTWLGALTLRHLAEFGRDIKLEHVADYAERVQQMATDRNKLQEAGAKVSDVWEKFQSADKVGADATANLMHDTTIAAIDPSQAYRPLLTGTTPRGGNEAVTAESIARRIALVDKDLDEAGSEDARRKLTQERFVLEGLLREEQARVRAYPEMVRRYQALPEKGREVYQGARKVYGDQSKALRDAIIARVTDAIESGAVRDAYIQQVKHTFEDARVRGPYFPLARFGDFWINAEKDGEPAFFMYEDVAAWRAGQTDLAKRGYVVKEAGRKIAEARSVAGVATSFMADLEGVLNASGADKQVMDDVWQMYLRTLPDLSIRKHFIHRKKVEGYSGDALRAFSGNIFHGSFQIARVRHSAKLEEELGKLKKATAVIAGDDPERAAKAAALATELGLRHEWVMNPKDSKTASKLTSLGFVWYLGLTPAAAMVNLTQTAIVTFPVLASRFGVAKSWNVLSAAMGHAMRSVNGDVSRGLNDQEREAFKILEASGALDRSMAHNLAGLSETDTRAYSHTARRTMEVVSFLFHKAEVINREATALAAFRLARDAGKDFHEATQYASDVITESHFDYCVDVDTECLTLDGWKRYDQIRAGDTVLAVDDLGRAVESRVDAINVFHGEKRVIDFASSRRFSMVVTPHHEAIVQNYDSKSRRWSTVTKVQAQDLKGHHHLLRAPLAPLSRDGGDPDFAALLGWIASEGWYAKFRNCTKKSDVRLSQSIQHNPEYVEEIRALLARLAVTYSEQKPAANGTITWTIGGDLRQRVLAAMPDKLLTFDMLRTMTTSEMNALLDAFCKGDGHQRKGGGWTIGQAEFNVQNLDVLQAMATALGRNATLSSSGANNLILTGGVKPSQRSIVKSLTRTERTVDTVWCPTTAHGTWIARRNGAVFVTGNSNANRARFMQGNVAKVLLLFRQYSLNMTWLLWRNFYLSTKGETPQVKKEARRKLVGVLGMTTMFAGVMGLPLTGLMFDVMNAAAAAFGDDDEPFDAEVEFRNFLADMFGPDLARVLTNGPLENLTGIELGSRVGLGELWLRSPDRELEGQALADYLLEQAAGPVVGGMLVNTLRGANMMAEGNTWRGFETMAPKSVKDAMKSLRYAGEGVNTMRGDPIIEDLSLPQTLLQLAGFSPAAVTEQYDANSAAKGYEQRILNRRSALLNAYAMAWRAEDTDGIQKALGKIQEWNVKHPRVGITVDTIRRSLASRMRFSAKADSGVVLDKRIADDAREQARFSE